MALHLRGEQRWSCPNCPTTDLTPGHVTNRFHACPGLKGLTAPLVLDGTDCKVEAVEREDYVGSEDVRLDGEGRPVMSVVTIRDDGQDCVAFAATAYAKGDE